MRYPVKQQAKNAVRKVVEGERFKYIYPCAECEEWFQDKEVQVDHIVGAGSLNEYSDLPRFVERLFCEPDNLQILCKPCHLIKTKKEKEQRDADKRKSSK